jgi:hypothetical protein
VDQPVPRIVRRVLTIPILFVTALILGGSASVAEASHAGGAALVAIDMDPSASPANTGLAVGSLETCARINQNETLDADEESVDALEIDVVIDDIPPPGAIATAFHFNFPNDPSVLVTQIGTPFATSHGWGPLDASDGPQNDGVFSHSVIDLVAVGTPGSGAISQLLIEAITGVVNGVFPLTFAFAAHIDTVGAAHFPDSLGGAFLAIDTPCPTTLDGDGDGVNDLDELSCGSDAFDSESVPERLDGGYAGRDDDGDTLVDEALPSGSSGSDCDGDGFTGSAEDRLVSYAAQTDGDQRVCGLHDIGFASDPSLSWPADLLSGGIPDSTDRVTILDILTFLTPVRYLGTDVGTNPNDSRWDLLTGESIFDPDINIQDLAALVSGSVGNPPMFGGQRAMNGPGCSSTPSAP